MVSAQYFAENTSTVKQIGANPFTLLKWAVLQAAKAGWGEDAAVAQSSGILGDPVSTAEHQRAQTL